MVTVGSLCTGYGGYELALKSVIEDVELSWYAENDKDCSKLMTLHYPEVPNLGDLTEVDWGEVPTVDILTAGFPCQPVSLSGIRKGEEDERWLWDDIEDALRILRPPIVLLENVSGILTLGGTVILGSLAEIGYDARWSIVRASEAGACHQRARWFCVAKDTTSFGAGEGQTGTVQGTSGGQDQFQGERRQDGGDTVRSSGSSEILRDTNQLHDDLPESGGSTSTDSDNERCEERNSTTIPIRETVAETAGSGEPATDTAGVGFKQGSGQLPTTGGRQKGKRSAGNAEPSRSIEDATDSDCRGLQELRTEHGLGETSEQPPVEPSGNDDDSIEWGQFEEGIRRWEFVTGRTAPRPTDERGLNPSFVEWMMGLPKNHVCNQGLSRTAELKMLGNGIVPQQCALALCVLLGDEQ
jgi:DNA (cytosine-5)-methyltransferase 1